MSSPVFPDLKGKVGVITGGAGILGSSMCEALAQSGARLVILGRDGTKAAALAASLEAKYKNEAIGLSCDVLDATKLEETRQLIHQKWGKVDWLINAAGGNDPSSVSKLEQLLPPDGQTMPEDPADWNLDGSFFDLQPAGFDKVFGLNFTGTLLPTKVFARDMVGRGGVILNVSSVSAQRPLTKVCAYGTAKAAVDNLTQWLAVHLARANVRVNALVPGFFLTEQNRFLLTDKDSGGLTARGQKVINATPMGRFGKPEELNAAVLFLLSQASSFVTGAVVPVDGGFCSYSGV